MNIKKIAKEIISSVTNVKVLEDDSLSKSCNALIKNHNGLFVSDKQGNFLKYKVRSGIEKVKTFFNQLSNTEDIGFITSKYIGDDKRRSKFVYLIDEKGIKKYFIFKAYWQKINRKDWSKEFGDDFEYDSRGNDIDEEKIGKWIGSYEERWTREKIKQPKFYTNEFVILNEDIQGKAKKESPVVIQKILDNNIYKVFSHETKETFEVAENMLEKTNERFCPGCGYKGYYGRCLRCD